ncbi:MacB family efflux pump subunit [Kordiimonas pumila]|uniref:MacB family efflux pump subunit n=1 Tax=Kordiimonas pumila TaxID=2161677 RepID=A0ABV7CZW1_9PROT|nr:MacB family efflux pump subunit [Kordiimonas pumila]
MSEKSQPLIELKNISRHFSSGETTVKALDNVNLSIYPGEFVAIMGQSGSGKSTMMNVLGCLDRPTHGSYQIMGTDVSNLSPDELAALRRQTFGFIFQRYNLLGTANAAENVEVPALYAGLSRTERQTRAIELLTGLGLGDRCDHRPAQLSGGQQQRVAIARALMNNPPVILADEPTGALDSKSSEDVMDLLKKLNAEGRTIIVITHEEEVAAHAERIIRIGDGKIVADNGTKPENEQTGSTRQSHSKLTGGSIVGETGEAVRTALRALRVNFFRTTLTLLGIIIGVAAVITMMAVGNGSKEKVLTQISSMGTNILNIRPGAPGIRNSGDNATLLPSDAQAISDNISNIEAVVPQRSGKKTLRLGNIDASTTVEGVGHTFPIARDWEVEKGTFFTEADIRSYAAVIVLGATAEKNFFPYGDDPIGKFILVGNIPFEIIGVMKSKGAAPWGGDQDDTAWVPYTTGLVRLFGSNYLNSITVKVDDVAQIEQTEADITALLKERHQIENFNVRNTASFLEMATETQNTLTVLLGAVAAISLLVGGIGVMNIMLVSVIERTREIGIRMATGARRRDIMIQFNTEAGVVCTIGGVIGVLLGFFAGYILSLFDVEIAFSTGPALLAFVCAVGTGLLFGFLPARKAAHLDPVVALSSE